MGLLPMGRVAGEAVRAVMLAPYVGKSLATVVAVQAQIVVLSITTLVTSLAAIVFVTKLGWQPMSWLGVLNAGLIAGVFVLAILAAKRFHIGRKLGFLLPRVKVFGEEFDAYFIGTHVLPTKAVLYEGLSRLSQLIQNGFLVLSVGGMWGISQAIASEGVHLVGATVGDLIPGQLGVHELVYSQAGTLLGIGAEQALSIALLAHISQMFGVALALVVPLLVVIPAKAGIQNRRPRLKQPKNKLHQDDEIPAR